MGEERGRRVGGEVFMGGGERKGARRKLLKVCLDEGKGRRLLDGLGVGGREGAMVVCTAARGFESKGEGQNSEV